MAALGLFIPTPWSDDAVSPAEPHDTVCVQLGRRQVRPPVAECWHVTIPGPAFPAVLEIHCHSGRLQLPRWCTC